MILSIIIPCFNHGSYLDEAIASLPDKNSLDYELIIVDDGSTDPFTLAKFDELRKNGHRIISHPNGGLAYSRNTGIAQSAGRYILPLDADNKINIPGLVKTVALLECGEYDIVYGKPKFFGEDIPSRKFRPKPFNGDELFLGNYIDACAVFKREVWEIVGGYDEKMPFQGNEDWEFWISAYLQGCRFKFLDEYCFEYRISGNSMLGSIVDNERKLANQRYLTNKHYEAHLDAFAKHFTKSRIYQFEQDRPMRTMLKYLRKAIFR